jgi:hypothetical protein
MVVRKLSIRLGVNEVKLVLSDIVFVPIAFRILSFAGGAYFQLRRISMLFGWFVTRGEIVSRRGVAYLVA